MGTQYYGRSWDEIMKLCDAEFRFYRNSLRNFRPGIGGAGVADIAEYLVDAVNQPKQSICLNLPAFCIDSTTAHFNFPANLDDNLGSEAAFTVEYYGVVQDRGIPDNYMALIGESGAATPYIGLRDGNLVEVNFGTQRISRNICWWWEDSLIHFVVTRASGAAPAFHAYINGIEVPFVSQLAGAGGFTDAAGEIFNHEDDQTAQHPFYGHHFLLRFYSVALEKYEVLELYQDAQRLMPHHLHHIGIFQSA